MGKPNMQTVERLSPRQIVAIRTLADPSRADLSAGQLAKAAGVSVRTMRRWRASPAFGRALLAEISSRLDEHLSAIFAALIERARRGEVRAAELLLRVRGLLNPQGFGFQVKAASDEPVEVVLSWRRAEQAAALEEALEVPERSPEEKLLAAVDQVARDHEAGRLVDPEADSARKAAELEARRRAEEAAREKRRLAAHAEIHRRRAAVETVESPWEARDPSSW